MTKEEILAAISNHRGDITGTLNNLVTTIDAMVRGYIPPSQQASMIDGLKSSLDYAKDKVAAVKGLLAEWPEE